MMEGKKKKKAIYYIIELPIARASVQGGHLYIFKSFNWLTFPKKSMSII